MGAWGVMGDGPDVDLVMSRCSDDSRIMDNVSKQMAI